MQIHGDPESSSRFRRINEAYEAISTKEKRKRFQKKGQQDYSDIFDEFFKKTGMFGGGQRRMKISLAFSESYSGCVKTIERC